MSFDVVIVGAGPSGLAAAIQLKQIAKQNQQPVSVCVLEKGAEVGSHILSGCVLDPRSLNELLPNWQQHPKCPTITPATHDAFYYLTKKNAYRMPLPRMMHNQGNLIVSLGKICQFLAHVAQDLGVEIFPGFAADDILLNEEKRIMGVKTGAFGLNRQGQPTEQFQPGMNLHCQQLIIAEGARGTLAKKIIQTFQLDQNSQPQTYGIGIKELWHIPETSHHPGHILHTTGWPLDNQTYGGGFLYHIKPQHLSVGLVVGLDYRNPYLDPYQEMQRLKTHPHLRSLFRHGERIAYGARALTEGGWQSIPKLSFPGGVLVGCSAGLMNVARLKGTHTAIQSGMLAAEAIFKQLGHSLPPHDVDKTFEPALRSSWIGKELWQVRNIRPAFHHGTRLGMLYSAIDCCLLKGRVPWTWPHHVDHQQLQPKALCPKIIYPPPDGTLIFDKLDSLTLSGVHHRDNQPSHLQLNNQETPIAINLEQYDSPETRYCPAGVYEILEDKTLQINAQNCIHCKTCDIKDPTQNIQWQPPEGGGGPHYHLM